MTTLDNKENLSATEGYRKYAHLIKRDKKLLKKIKKLQEAFKDADIVAEKILSSLETSTLEDFYKLPKVNGFVVLSLIRQADEKAKNNAQKVTGAKNVIDGRWKPRDEVLDSANIEIEKLISEGKKHTEIATLLWNAKESAYRTYNTTGNRTENISRATFLKHVKKIMKEKGKENLITGIGKKDSNS